MNRIFKILILLTLITSCKNNNQGLISENAMVVSARSEASQIGIDILKKGGNAFDAMVATELALAVCYPSAGNIGGGGFMIYRKNEGEVGALDYREKAPKKSSKDMYLDDEGEIIEGLSMIGGLSIGVPGTIAGVFEVHDKFGSLPIEELIKPAIDLANKGVKVTKKQSEKINENLEYFKLANKEPILFSNGFKTNDTIKYKNLASTLWEAKIAWVASKTEVSHFSIFFNCFWSSFFSVDFS